MPEDDLDIGFCPRCGDQLDCATPPADLICWRCAADEEEDVVDWVPVPESPAHPARPKARVRPAIRAVRGVLMTAPVCAGCWAHCWSGLIAGRD